MQTQVEGMRRQLAEVRLSLRVSPAQAGRTSADKTKEAAQLLDARAARIRKLEEQLREVAYGSHSRKITFGEAEDSSAVPACEVASLSSLPIPATEKQTAEVQLEKGQNLFEISILRGTVACQTVFYLCAVLLTPAALAICGNDPRTFVTYDFFQHETQSSAVCVGPSPMYAQTSQYVVSVDATLLQYLQRGSMAIELHQAVGTDFRTLAACKVPGVHGWL
jgi:protein fantom